MASDIVRGFIEIDRVLRVFVEELARPKVEEISRGSGKSERCDRCMERSGDGGRTYPGR
jgi:hypothetical protein